MGVGKRQARLYTALSSTIWKSMLRLITSHQNRSLCDPHITLTYPARVVATACVYLGVRTMGMDIPVTFTEVCIYVSLRLHWSLSAVIVDINCVFMWLQWCETWSSKGDVETVKGWLIFHATCL